MNKLGNINLLQEQRVKIHLSRGETKKAKSILKTQYEKRPNKVPYFFEMGRIQASLNETQKAMESFKYALEIFDTLPKRVSGSKAYEGLRDSIHHQIELLKYTGAP